MTVSIPIPSLHLFPLLVPPNYQLLIYPLDDLLRFRVLPERLHKLSSRIHQVHKDTMVDQIVTLGIGTRWCREIYAVGFAHRFYGGIIAYEANEALVEVT